jgi:hypothetical protein
MQEKYQRMLTTSAMTNDNGTTYDASIFYDMGEVARNSTKEDEATEVRHGTEKLPKEKNTMNLILSATNISNDGIIEIYAEVCR